MLSVLALAAALGELTVLPVGAREYPVAQVVRVLQEPPLESLNEEAKMFRFIWMPPFPSMRLFAVRLENTGGGTRMTAKSARWTYDKSLTISGHVESVVQRQLSADAWAELASLREDGFWRFRPEVFPQPMHDGAVWVLEGTSAGERLRIVQHVPGPGPFRTLCRRMFQLFNPPLTDAEESLGRE